MKQQTLSQLLERAEKAEGVNQTQAAMRCGTSRPTYRAWKRGQRPELERLDDIARFVAGDRQSVEKALWQIQLACGYITGRQAAILRRHLRVSRKPAGHPPDSTPQRSPLRRAS